MSNYYNPVKVIQTNKWADELSKNFTTLNMTYPLVVTSPGNLKRLNLKTIFNDGDIYCFPDSNPTFDDCDDIIRFCKGKEFDGVIAIGGGSPMDLAKVAVAFLSIGEENVLNLIGYKDEYPKVIPSIFIPTTHGTGSEVTMWGTIWNMNEKIKYSISHPSLYPNIAILDGNLTISLPLDISIITVMDALSHSFEAIWNKNANDTSTFYAISAITMILENINALKKESNCLDARNKLLLASNKAGLAFSNTKTAAAHSISYPLTINYGIPHGIASSISLIFLLEINRNYIDNAIKNIIKSTGMTFEELSQAIKIIPEGVIPFTLTEYGIHIDQIMELAEKSFTKGRMDNNIIDLALDDVLKILKQAI